MNKSTGNNGQFLKHYILFFLIFIVYYIIDIVTPQQIDTYIATQYLTSYDLGFISRGFIGSLISLLFNKISTLHIHFIVTMCNLFLISIATYFVTKVYVSVEQKLKFVIFCIVLFFCINPAGITFLFNQRNFGRLELFSVIIMLISVIIIMKRSKLVYIVPILCVASILIYQTAIFMYLPIIFVLLFYIAKKEDDKRYMWIFIVSFTLSCVLFLYMQCLGKITMYLLDETISRLSKNSFFNPSDEYLRAEYYMKVSGHLELMNNRMPIVLYRLIISLVIYIPIIYFIYYVYIKSFKNADRKQKLAYLAILINVLTIVPVFIFAVDYGRWISAIFITQIVLILSLVYMKDNLILDALESLQAKLLAKKYFVIGLIAMYGVLPRFTHYEVLPLVNNINRIIDTVNSYLNILLN